MTPVLAALILSAPVPPPRPVPCAAGVYVARNNASAHRIYLRPDGLYVCEWDGVTCHGTWTADRHEVRIEDTWCDRPFPWRFSRDTAKVYFRDGLTDYKIIRVTMSDGRPVPR